MRLTEWDADWRLEGFHAAWRLAGCKLSDLYAGWETGWNIVDLGLADRIQTEWKTVEQACGYQAELTAFWTSMLTLALLHCPPYLL